METKMKKTLTFLISFLMLFILTQGQVFAYKEVNLLDKTPSEYEKITITTGAVSMLNETYRNAAGAVFITVENNNIRYRIDGGDPDATNGHLIISGAYQNLWLFAPGSIRGLRMIAIGGNAVAIVTYYRKN